MGAPLPEIPDAELERQLRDCSPVELSAASLDRLRIHYRELRRWNPSASLIGPGDRQSLLQRHFGESLAALPLLPAGPLQLVDLGSGGGFPGLVLAAARPDLGVTLVEARQRKWAFLETVCRKAALSCRCLNAKVGATLPEGLPQAIDIVTCRAVRLSRDHLAALETRLTAKGELLLWVGARAPEAATEWTEVARHRLPGSRQRTLVALRPPLGAPS